MRKQLVKIGTIPAILWGEKSDKLFIAIHGNMSNKSDDVISVFAQEATVKGYQVVSFDLPEHGERKNEPTLCKAANCVKELNTVLQYAQSLSANISIFACSMGAYFSLLAYGQENLQRSLFLSPVVDMECIINNMMSWFQISVDDLRHKKEISTPIGQTLYWDYYCYVKEHPVEKWNISTAILYGSEDNVCECSVVEKFATRFHCDMQIVEQGAHYFHTPMELDCLRRWANKYI